LTSLVVEEFKEFFFSELHFFVGIFDKFVGIGHNLVNLFTSNSLFATFGNVEILDNLFFYFLGWLFVLD
jgi:hypothetical protein